MTEIQQRTRPNVTAIVDRLIARDAEPMDPDMETAMNGWCLAATELSVVRKRNAALEKRNAALEEENCMLRLAVSVTYRMLGVFRGPTRFLDNRSEATFQGLKRLVESQGRVVPITDVTGLPQTRREH